MYEQHYKALLPRRQFLRRLARHAGVALALLVFSLLLGMLGYRGLEHLSWPDAFLNAAMLLGGMGPVAAPVTMAGKLFAGLYALYAGLVFLFSFGVFLIPIFHRFLHNFHLVTEEEEEGEEAAEAGAPGPGAGGKRGRPARTGRAGQGRHGSA